MIILFRNPELPETGIETPWYAPEWRAWPLLFVLTLKWQYWLLTKLVGDA